MLPGQNLSGKILFISFTSMLTTLEHTVLVNTNSPVLVPFGSVNVSIEHAKMRIL